MIHKMGFFCLWAMWFIVWLIGGFTHMARGVVHCAWLAFMTPGWLVVVPLGHFRQVPVDNHGAVALAVVISALCWFFPLARIRREFGSFDAFKNSDRPRPRLLGAAVFVSEQVNKRLFGRQKTGGWA